MLGGLASTALDEASCLKTCICYSVSSFDDRLFTSFSFLDDFGGGSLRNPFSKAPPQDLAVETIELLLGEKYNKTENPLGHAQVIQLLKFCHKTYFTFDGTTYEQVKDTPMDSPISGLITEAILQRLESTIFRHHRLNFWARYADDTFVVMERDGVQTLKERLNAVFPDVQVKMKEKKNNQLAFQDVLVCRKIVVA
ncbi:hypothetical protein SprV_0301370600 [Sparganum proliferum]